MQHWPAITRWQRPGYFVKVAGLRTVPVELGEHYLHDGWGQSLMPLGRFISQHVLQASDASDAGAGIFTFCSTALNVPGVADRDLVAAWGEAMDLIEMLLV